MIAKAACIYKTIGLRADPLYTTPIVHKLNDHYFK